MALERRSIGKNILSNYYEHFVLVGGIVLHKSKHQLRMKEGVIFIGGFARKEGIMLFEVFTGRKIEFGREFRSGRW
jgi:hypothetical protein